MKPTSLGLEPAAAKRQSDKVSPHRVKGIGHCRVGLIAVFVLFLTACTSNSDLPGDGFDDEGDAIPTGVASFQLLDPTPGAGDLFGKDIVVLGNGNIVVTDPFDSSVVANGGAVHLYDPVTQTLIASIYGDSANDNLGSDGIVELANNNYVIISSLDDEGGVGDAGSVRLMNGATGVQMGPTLAGDLAGDQLGAGGVTALANGNYVVASPFDNDGALLLAGSARLMNGTTAVQIAAIIGDSANDNVAFGGVVELDNGNYVVSSMFENVGPVTFAGTARLFNGTTGAQIGTTIAGDMIGDSIGAGGVKPLVNGNYVILSPGDNENSVFQAGSMRLVDGATGAQIGATIAGDVPSDKLGLGISAALSNGNFVFGSIQDDEGGNVDAGSVRLIDGATGAQIAIYVGGPNDQAGYPTALANGNYVIASPFADVGLVADAGSVRLMNGTTGVQIGAAIEGDVAGDQLGLGSVLALANNNYIISSITDDESGLVDAGSFILVDGTNGLQIGGTIAGDVAGDQLGFGTVNVLLNDNIALGSFLDNEGGILDAGSVRLIDGSTGAQIGTTLAGDTAGDQIGNFDIVPLANSNYVVISSLDDEGGVVDAGSVRLVNGATGVQIGSTVTGVVANDVSAATIGAAANGAYFVLGLSTADNNGLVDSGLVLLNAD
jgi:hypothetical protein